MGDPLWFKLLLGAWMVLTVLAIMVDVERIGK